jgi:hypothetical protein
MPRTAFPSWFPAIFGDQLDKIHWRRKAQALCSRVVRLLRQALTVPTWAGDEGCKPRVEGKVLIYANRRWLLIRGLWISPRGSCKRLWTKLGNNSTGSTLWGHLLYHLDSWSLIRDRWM